MNLLCLFCTFAAFVGCCVAFGGDMFRAQVQLPSAGESEYYFYESNFQRSGENRVYYSNPDMCIYDFCSMCSSGGKGFLALMVLSFIILLFHMVIIVFRIMGGVAISAIALPTRSILVESWLTTGATLLYFIAVVVYGSTCYRSVQNTPLFTVTISGFAYTILSFFLLFLTLVLYHFIRVQPECHLGWAQKVGAAGWNGMNEEFVTDEERYVDEGDRSVAYGDASEHSQASASTYQQSTGAPPVDAIRTNPSRAQR
jgi:hypothetical protein